MVSMLYMVMSVVMVCYPALEVDMVMARMVRSRGTMVRVTVQLTMN